MSYFKSEGKKRPMSQLKVGRPKEFLLNFFVLFKSFADWVRPTHIREVNLLYSKSTNVNVNLIKKKKFFYGNIQNNV